MERTYGSRLPDKVNADTMRPLFPFVPVKAEQSSNSRQHSPRKLLFTLFFGCLFFCWLLFNHATPWTRKIVSDLTGSLSALLSMIWAFQGAVKGKKRVWGADLVACYLLLYSAGMICWTYLELIQHQEAPFPSLADAFYIPSQLCLMAGIVILPFRRAPAALRSRVLLDGLMMMASLVAFSWYFVLGPNLLAMAATTLAKVLGVCYPLSDLAILICLLVLTARAPSASLRAGYTALATGVLGIVVTDSLYGYLALKGTYASGSLLDVGWPCSQLLLAWAAATLRRGADEVERTESETFTERNPILWRSLLPYALIPPLGLLLLFVQRTNGLPVLEVGVYASSAVLIGLILLRQVFALLENNRLYGYLKQAYKEVETSHQEMQVKSTMMEQANADLAQANARLEALAYTDGMTGLFNHRTFQEKLRKEWASARESDTPFSMLLMDVDHFKQYNDTFGHPAGDEALRLVVQLIRENLPSTAIAARYGGEEFVVILPQTDSAEMLKLAEEIRRDVESYAFPHRKVTLSVGAVEATAECLRPEELIASADRALYLAKSKGRNCVCRAEEENGALLKAA